MYYLKYELGYCVPSQGMYWFILGQFGAVVQDLGH